MVAIALAGCRFYQGAGPADGGVGDGDGSADAAIDAMIDVPPGAPCYGAPPFQVYVMPQNLKPRVFAGTATMFFAAVDLIKVPPYFLLGQFSGDNLKVSLALIPVAVLSTFAGVWLVRRIDAARFYAIILVITFLIGVKLAYDALQALA